MHVHPNQVTPSAELDAMYAAQKAAAKGEAERTRRKLTEFASELAAEGDFEACVVKLETREESEPETRRNRRQRTRRLKQGRDAEPKGISISDWA